MEIVDRIVVGAGLSGLLAGWRAVERGEQVIIIDRNERAGGVVQSISVAGIDVDAGAESFSTVDPSCRRLVDELGLANDVVEPYRSDARIINHVGDRYRIPHGLLGIPASLDDPALDGIISPDGLARARKLDSAPFELRNVLTISDLVSQRLGDEFVEKLADPVLSGVHGSSANGLLVRSVMPAVLDALVTTGSLASAVAKVRGAHPRPGAAVASLRGGLFRLVDNLTKFLREKGVVFQQNCEVIHLDRGESRWNLQTSRGVMSSNFLTIAGGVTTTHNLLSSVDNLETAHRSTGAVSVSLVMLAVKSAQLSTFPIGSGALLVPHSACVAKATTHVNAKWKWVDELLPDGQHLVRLSYGRDGNIPGGNLTETAVKDVSYLYESTDAIVLDSIRVDWTDGLYQRSPDSSPLVDEIVRIARLNDIEICGPFLTGNGLMGITRDHYERMHNGRNDD